MDTDGSGGGSAVPWAVIPAAGRGTRLRGHTEEAPKALVPVGGRPLVAWVLDRVAGLADGVCLVVPEGDDAVPARLGAEWDGTPLRWARQPEPRGVADAVLRARPHVRGPLLVVMGDVVYGDPLAPHLRRWRRGGADGAVLVEPASTAGSDPVGRVRLEGDRVVDLRKAPPSEDGRHRLAGAAVLPPRALEAGPHLSPSAETGELELEAMISWLLGEGHRFRALRYDGWRRNVNTPADVEAVERRLAAQQS